MITLPEGTFYGAERDRRQIDGLVLTEVDYRPGEALPSHNHERAYFCLVVRGGFMERDGFRKRECDSATLIFHPPGVGHSDRFGRVPSRCFNVELDDRWLGRISEAGCLPQASVVFRRQRTNWLARHLYDEFRASDPVGRLAIEGLALALLADALRFEGRVPRPAPRWVDRAVEMVRADPANPPGLGEIAAEIGIHPVHLARVFRGRHGCSIGEYARRIKIERAAETLGQTGLPIGRLAHRLGYADHSHFSRSFRRATGLSPSEYRRRHGFAGTGGASADQESDGAAR
ncbi:MAG: helix-turn-helix transcriptional regulator [Gemmatimonadota bacterium]